MTLKCILELEVCLDFFKKWSGAITLGKTEGLKVKLVNEFNSNSVQSLVNYGLVHFHPPFPYLPAVINISFPIFFPQLYLTVILIAPLFSCPWISCLLLS